MIGQVCLLIGWLVGSFVRSLVTFVVNFREVRFFRKFGGTDARHVGQTSVFNVQEVKVRGRGNTTLREA